MKGIKMKQTKKAKLYAFDEDSGVDVARDMCRLPQKQLYFRRKSVDGVMWFFFCKEPITDKMIEDWANCDEDW